MNPKRLILAIVVVFVGVFATDFLIHGVWLKSTYVETQSLWRPEAEMQAHMGAMMSGQFLAALTFVVLYAMGIAAKRCPGYAAMYGLGMGLFSQATTLITYAVQPFPASLAMKWFAAGVVQGVLLGLLVYFVYKPRAEPAMSAV